ncbi:MAG: Do family serine endopeptidase [Helicobacteraceae bacterium]|jgi:serine protease Do|nr:Do family serine endopeptidase [Helicobacteraceae bacterium]
MKRLIALSLVSCVAFASPKIAFQDYENNNIERVQPAAPALASYAQILKSARQSVVNVSIQKNVRSPQIQTSPFFNDPFFRQFFDEKRFNIPRDRIERSLGSGVIIGASGYIVTNNHVIEGASKVIVTLANSKEEFEAKVIGLDPKSDLAVIKIEAKNLRPAVFFNSDNVEVGDLVFAIGNPFGVGETITMGMVSATNRAAVSIVEYEDFIQTDAAINPGNSGGALVNSTGALIGLNSAILTRSGANHGIGFSIPSNMVKRIAEQLIENGEVTRAWLGVSISDLSEDLQGFYDRNVGAVVTSVEPKSPAEKAGLKRGDLITKVDSKTIDGANSLRNIIGSFAPNKKVALDVVRDKKTITLNATLTTMDKTASAEVKSDYKGLSVAPLNDEARSRLRLSKEVRGVIVDNVADNSEAQQAGFASGDVIVQVESAGIIDIDSFKKATASSAKKRFYVLRRGASAVFVVAL